MDAWTNTRCDDGSIRELQVQFIMLKIALLDIGVRANIHLGGQTEFCPNGFSGGGVVAEHFPGSIFCGVAEFFPSTAVTDPKFVLFKHVLCFARIMSTNCPNWGGSCPPSRTPMLLDVIVYTVTVILSVV